MTKTQLWNEVQELMVEHKANKKLASALEDLLKPKAGGGSSVNPPKEVDGVMHYYCRFHETYEPQENMVLSGVDKDGNKKSKGYCKASISLWNKTNSQIKRLDSQMSELVADGNFDEAQAIANESKELKASLNDSKSYDLERDWDVFNAPKTKSTED